MKESGVVKMKYFEVILGGGESAIVLEAKNKTQAAKKLRALGYIVREVKEGLPDYYDEWYQKTFDGNDELIDLVPRIEERMKNTKATIKPMIETLEELFVKLNNKYFDGKLERPVITIAPDTCRAYGWFTTWRAWKETEIKDSEGYYEITITSDYLDRTPVEIAGTLLHEMVHLYNQMNGINDCSRGGKYHNIKFKESAEAHGLETKKDSRYGWSITSPSTQTAEYLESLKLSFPLYRPTPEKGQRVRKKSSTRKYVCPICGTIIRATKEVHVTCSDCGVEFEEFL